MAKRSWAEKQRILAERQDRGETYRATAARYGVCAGTLEAWAAELRRRALAGGGLLGGEAQVDGEASVGFLEVLAKRSSDGALREATRVAAVLGGVRFEFDALPDPDWVVAVAARWRGLPC